MHQPKAFFPMAHHKILIKINCRKFGLKFLNGQLKPLKRAFDWYIATPTLILVRQTLLERVSHNFLSFGLFKCFWSNDRCLRWISIFLANLRIYSNLKMKIISYICYFSSSKIDYTYVLLIEQVCLWNIAWNHTIFFKP